MRDALIRSVVIVSLLSAGMAHSKAARDEAARKEVQPQVQAAQKKAIGKKESEAVKEALDAVLATRAALEALDKGETKQALAHLEIANGKLALLLARYPELGLIPVDSEAIVVDYKGDIKSIEEAVDEAEDLLDDGKVQAARAVLSPLASEIRFTTTNLPLAIYPDVMKQVAPLIEAGKIKEAKETLLEALSTLVITESVIPLPLLRAEAMVRKAADLAQGENPDREKILRLLGNAKYQLRLTRALGYGDVEKDYKPLYAQVKQLEKKVKARGWGSKLDQAIERFQQALRGLRTRIGEPQKAH